MPPAPTDMDTTDMDPPSLSQPPDDARDEQYLQTLPHSQPWPRTPSRTLPPDLITHLNNPQVAGEYETLLQRVPPHQLDAFFTLVRNHVAPAVIRDNILPFWELPTSASSANTNP